MNCSSIQEVLMIYSAHGNVSGAGSTRLAGWIGPQPSWSLQSSRDQKTGGQVRIKRHITEPGSLMQSRNFDVLTMDQSFRPYGHSFFFFKLFTLHWSRAG